MAMTDSSKSRRRKVRKPLLLQLDEKNVETLKAARWFRCGSSVTDEFFERSWDLLMPYLPLSIAPNSITLIGLFGLVLGALPLFFSNATAAGECPPHAYVICAFAIFVYQTCDALDGKQARRTGNVSPLGAIADWTADSTSVAIIPIICCVFLNVARHGNALMILLCVFYTTGFYAASWETCMYGVYHFRLLDDVETQAIMMVLLLLTALFGPGIWELDLTFGLTETGLLLKFVVLLILWLPEASMVVAQTANVCKYASGRLRNDANDDKLPAKQPDSADTNGEPAAESKASADGCDTYVYRVEKSGDSEGQETRLRLPFSFYYPLAHLLVAFSVTFALWYVAETSLAPHMAWFALIACLPIAKSTDMLAVSTSTAKASVFPLLDPTWLAGVLLLLDALVLFPLPVHVAVGLSVLVLALDYIYWHWCAWHDLAFYLGINVFKPRRH